MFDSKSENRDRAVEAVEFRVRVRVREHLFVQCCSQVGTWEW